MSIGIEIYDRNEGKQKYILELNLGPILKNLTEGIDLELNSKPVYIER